MTYKLVTSKGLKTVAILTKTPVRGDNVKPKAAEAASEVTSNHELGNVAINYDDKSRLSIQDFITDSSREKPKTL